MCLLRQRSCLSFLTWEKSNYLAARGHNNSTARPHQGHNRHQGRELLNTGPSHERGRRVPAAGTLKCFFFSRAVAVLRRSGPGLEHNRPGASHRVLCPGGCWSGSLFASGCLRCRVYLCVAACYACCWFLAGPATDLVLHHLPTPRRADPDSLRRDTARHNTRRCLIAGRKR